MASKKRKRPINPEAVQAAGLAALDAALAALAAAGLGRLPTPIVRGPLQIGNAPVKKPKGCTGCPDVPRAVAEKAESVQRVYLIVEGATRAGEYIGTKEIVKRSRAQREGQIPTRTVGRALGVLRDELRLVYLVPGRGNRLGQAPALFSAT